MALLLSTGATIFGGMVIRFRKPLNLNAAQVSKAGHLPRFLCFRIANPWHSRRMADHGISACTWLEWLLSFPIALTAVVT